MKELVSYRIPARDETVVTLYDDCSVEINQWSYPEEESEVMTQPVRIATWDLPDLIELLDRVRRYKPPEPTVPVPSPKPPLESMGVAPAKKKGPLTAD